MADGHLFLTVLPHEYGKRSAVDIFFRTLAETDRSRSRCRIRRGPCGISDPAAALALGSNEWPALVGVGSVCLRHLTGPNNLYRIVDALEEALPSHVGFHLFGVKSTALAKLKDRSRVISADSMAWNYAARREAYAKRIPKTKELLCEKMTTWVERQRRLTKPGAQLVML
jgi:hypothetical protein